MLQYSEIFEKHYKDYCDRIAHIDLGAIRARLGMEQHGDQMMVRFFNRDYLVSGRGIADMAGNRPEYTVCVVLAKYILLCPDQAYYDPAWVAFKDFKRTSHFTNVNYFTSDTEQVLLKTFTGRLADLVKAGGALGGRPSDLKISYDLSMQFQALPRISLALLFNDGDDEFPAHGTVLFQKHAEYYLDPESLAMSSAFLARSLRELT